MKQPKKKTRSENFVGSGLGWGRVWDGKKKVFQDLCSADLKKIRKQLAILKHIGKHFY